ncbi:MAG: GNAT family N-acetyltransferase [Cyclobacteriaceae bacterium]|nr:GNAT family N-acetyltransferase [Cyclobacteriaceae bacterium]
MTTTPNLPITRLNSTEDIEICTKIFSNSEPWITLGMDSELFIKILSDPLNEVYVLKVEKEIAGVVVLQMQGPFPGYVKAIVIDGKWKGKGYGRLLLEFSEQRVFKESPNVFLCVSSFNDKAQPFYQKMGYQKIGVIENYLISGLSEILMRKTKGPVFGYNQTDTN